MTTKKIYQPQNIWNIARALVKKLGISEPNLREDLRQEFVLGALTALRKVNRTVELGANRFIWLNGYYGMIQYWKKRDKWDKERSCSLHELVFERGEHPEERYSKLKDYTVPDPHETLEGIELSDISSVLLSQTNRQRRWILYFRYMRPEPMTLAQLARRYKCSKQNISQLEHRGLEDIRRWMISNLHDFSMNYRKDFGPKAYLEAGDLWEEIDGMWEKVNG